MHTSLITCAAIALHTYIATYADTQENKGIGGEVKTPVLVAGTSVLTLYILALSVIPFNQFNNSKDYLYTR